MPGLRLVIRYVPDSSVSAVREIPVATFNAVIFAFGTSAALLSVTEPAKDPDCANTLGAKHTNAITTSQIALQLFIGRPLNSVNAWMQRMSGRLPHPKAISARTASPQENAPAP